jgi:hypothetical protein
VQTLSLDELLCFGEMADTYGLPVSYADVVHSGSAKVRDADELFMFANAVSTFYARLEAEKESREHVANDLAAAAERVLLETGDTPVAFERVVEALVFSWMLPDDTLNGSMCWKREVMRRFGIAIGRDRNVAEAIMGSYVTNITDDLVDVSGVLATENFLPTDLAQVHEAIQGNTDYQTIHDTFTEKSRVMYRDLCESVSDSVAKKLARCFAKWMISVGMPLNVDLEFDKGIVMSYPFLEYNPLHDNFFYSVATGQVEQVTGLQVYYSQTIADFDGLLRKANKVTVSLDPALLRRHLLDPTDPAVCSDPETLVTVGYPFVLGDVLPSAEFNQFGQCVVSTNLKYVRDRAVREPRVTDAVQALPC